MILCNSDAVDKLFERDTRLRRCAMATTVITPKLILLLDIIQLKHQDSRIAEAALENRRKCANYVHNCMNVPEQNPAVLRLAANLYYLYDDVLVTSSIEDKVVAWKTTYQIAARQLYGASPVKISVSDIPFLHTEYCDLATESIERELYDYSDEIEAWLDLYMTDYDDYDESEHDGQDIYDEAVSIMTDLRFLAGILKSGE